jgi:hypothetical protein
MKNNRIVSALLAFATALIAVSPSLGREGHHNDQNKAAPPAAEKKGQLVALTKENEAWAAKARKEYPMNVCLTSDEKLGSMGENVEFIYREAGQPDRLLVFCCSGCEEDFMDEPGKYLSKLDAAAKAKKKDTASAAEKGHKGHH